MDEQQRFHDRMVVGNIHFPIVRTQTRKEWQDCEDVINEHAGIAVETGRPYFLTTDMNDKSGKLFNPRQMTRIGGKGIDYIGVRLPKGWRLHPKNPAQPMSVSLLGRKQVPGTIDNHDFYGVKVQVVGEDGAQSVCWLVTANLGRGEPAEVFTKNVQRIKLAFTGPAIFGFQEIDEADRPQEHEELRDVMGRPQFRAIGWGSMNPILMRRLKPKNARITQACDGVARFTPSRLLIEGGIPIG